MRTDALQDHPDCRAHRWTSCDATKHKETLMKSMNLKTATLIAALLALAVLPLAAAGLTDAAVAGRAVAPGAEIASFFEARGVDSQYLGMDKSQIPAAQWKKIVTIVNAPDTLDADGNIDYDNDHNMLNSLVFETLAAATDAIDDPVYLRLGGIVWTHVVEDSE